MVEYRGELSSYSPTSSKQGNPFERNDLDNMEDWGGNQTARNLPRDESRDFFHSFRVAANDATPSRRASIVSWGSRYSGSGESDKSKTGRKAD